MGVKHTGVGLQRAADGGAEATEFPAEVPELDVIPAADGGQSRRRHRRVVPRPQAAAVHAQGGRYPEEPLQEPGLC